jgi:intracellular septation protein
MTEVAASKPAPNMTKLVVDFGPLLAFILTYAISKSPYIATGVFMGTMGIAMIYAKLKLGTIPPLLMVSGIMILVFGGLTIYLHDQRFIQLKPTLYYALFSGILIYGGYTKRPLLKQVLGDVYPELSERGWHQLGRSFAWFFLIAALANEFIRHQYSFAVWGWTKLWLFTPASMLVGLLNVPMILRESEAKSE